MTCCPCSLSWPSRFALRAAELVLALARLAAPNFTLASAACAYLAVLAFARIRPLVHLLHCRTWTMLAVAAATPLCGCRGHNLFLGLFALWCCPATLLWWPGGFDDPEIGRAHV